MDQSPSLIQSDSQLDGTATSLVLFHNAFCLGSSDRPVYGISNPKFDSGGDWSHGLRQMSVVYTHLIDIARSCKYLGWDEYGTGFIRACWDTPGNHFALFDDPHVCLPSPPLQSFWLG
ncbi:hypothetical protein BO70DRAFT_395082 [Aspergillus heteromorphus CBS 117.55]|uniref:Uncharacterized protein n=1 Tax=Aspergillus heteromorphus CBS 117.55 TaxID=1448321 RepID=A0A317WNW7_9EURO|nr:uncharacterized protein BO70DRAFT_395082 [Aspergillus heteromorphus CBS 117.55]PWY85950.1 hypothetical protein BO70DRAFT_395082 [Aspergillus heteromorphus CBS 117.55]